MRLRLRLKVEALLNLKIELSLSFCFKKSRRLNASPTLPTTYPRDCSDAKMSWSLERSFLTGAGGGASPPSARAATERRCKFFVLVVES